MPQPPPVPAPVPAPVKRAAWKRLGWWLVIALWPSVAVFMLVAWLVWEKTDANTAWALAGGAALLFFALWSLFRARARATGRKAVVVLRGMVVSLLVVAAVVGAVWLVFFR